MAEAHRILSQGVGLNCPPGKRISKTSFVEVMFYIIFGVVSLIYCTLIGHIPWGAYLQSGSAPRLQKLYKTTPHTRILLSVPKIEDPGFRWNYPDHSGQSSVLYRT